jgi:hypothetical protein
MFSPNALIAQNDKAVYLSDRDGGIPLSMFGTYINEGEFMIYPFYEYYHDSDAEYSPQELGYQLDEDFFGKYRAHEGLIFLGYGISDYLAIELEAAFITATQYKSKDDPTDLPDKIEESGLGDVEGQLRYRWNKENETTPEYFSYFETVFPLQKDKKLIGTSDWEFKFGSGIMKGFSWGTLTARIAVEYDRSENKTELGEYAVEYLKRISKLFRFYVGIEGSQDEIELITDLQFHVFENGFIRINNAFGVTKKATDYAPEIGILFRF